MKRRITRPRSLVLVVALAVIAAMCTVSTAHAASPGGGAGGLHPTSSHATAASDTPCSFVPSLTCQSTDRTIALNIDYYGEQSGCTYAWHVDWGDGNSQDFTVTEPADDYVFLANHTYSTTPRTYTITVTGQVTVGTCTANPFTAQFTLLAPPPPPPAPSPTIYWSQISGRPGTHVTLTGNGWVPGGTVQIHLPSNGFFTGNSSWHVDSNGTWTQNFTVGNTTTPGMYKLSFSENSGHLLVTGSFRVLLPLGASADKCRIDVRATGFAFGHLSRSGSPLERSRGARTARCCGRRSRPPQGLVATPVKWRAPCHVMVIIFTLSTRT